MRLTELDQADDINPSYPCRALCLTLLAPDLPRQKY